MTTPKDRERIVSNLRNLNMINGGVYLVSEAVSISRRRRIKDMTIGCFVGTLLARLLLEVF